MQRAIAIAILKGSSTTIHNPSYCDDAIALIGIAKVLGFTIKKRSRYLELIPGSNNSEKFILNFRESGLGIRMLSPILACQKKSFVLTGIGSLKKRPMTMIENGLRDLDVFVKSENGYLAKIQTATKINMNRNKMQGTCREYKHLDDEWTFDVDEF